MTSQTQAQPHPRRHSSCRRHPTATPFTGVCASCLCERLSGIQSQSPISKAPPANAQLQRSKSCSGRHNPSSSSASEPRRKSCDVRTRNALQDLNVADYQIEDLNPNPNPNPNPPLPSVDVIAGFQDLEEFGELKPMKEFIDLECSSKKSSSKSFWSTASLFSKKLGKWRRKEEKKEKSTGLEQAQIPNVRRLSEIQAEVWDYGLGRRSCDTEPRLSIEVGRFSVDDSRFCLEVPRASWDGYLFGQQNPRPPQMVLVKDVMPALDEEEKSPGGSAQTRDYYADSASSHRRRRSFDRAGLSRKVGIGETAGLKSPLSNAKVSPETAGLFHGAKLLVTEKELRDSNWYSLKDYRKQIVEPVEFVDSGVSDLKKVPKWKNLLSFRSLLQRKKATNIGGNGMIREEETVIGHRHSSVEGNWRKEKLLESLQTLRRASNAEEYREIGVETLAESLQKLRRVSNADEDRIKEADSPSFVKGAVNGSIVGEKLLRSYNVSCRDSSKAKDDCDKRMESRGLGYSPNNLDNGLLRFYLTPLRSYGRNKSEKNRLNSAQSAGLNVL